MKVADLMHTDVRTITLTSQFPKSS